MDSGQRTTDRWGIKGSEDLGGGLMASFTLEGAYNSDTGSGPNASGSSAGLFGRKAIVGLSKGGNSVTLGHDYTANFKSQGIYDPMSYTYTGITPSAVTNVAGTRNSNMIEAGFRFGTGGVLVEYAMAPGFGQTEQPTTDGNRMGFMADFGFGPVTVTGAYSTVKDQATGTLTTKTTNIGGKYAMGAFTFRAGWSKTEAEGGSDTPLFLLGVQYKMSPTMDGRLGYYSWKVENNATGVEQATAKLFIAGLDFIMSKQTTAYVVIDRYSADGTLQTAAFSTLNARQDGSTGIGAGIVHAF